MKSFPKNYVIRISETNEGLGSKGRCLEVYEILDPYRGDILHIKRIDVRRLNESKSLDKIAEILDKLKNSKS